jgi:RimJ/RimL family protein N-acetyltransferase
VLAISSGPVVPPDPSAGQHFAVEGPRTDLPALFAAADLVVSAAGVTLLELCCVGVPTALIRLVDNQAAGYRAALEQGVAVGLGDVRRLLTDELFRAELAGTALSTVDGRGAARVLDVVASTPIARPAAQQDAALLLAWRNDPVTRAWSRGSAAVEPDEHADWLHGVLASAGRHLLVVACGGEPAGTVRFDQAEPGVWEVSVALAPERRGRGLAGPILAAAEAHLRARHPVRTLLAGVHRDNAASRALFTRAGYHEHPDHPAADAFTWLVKSP